MEKASDFVVIPCRVCYTTTVILPEHRAPSKCVKCRAPYDPTSANFNLAAASSQARGRRTDRRPSIA